MLQMLGKLAVVSILLAALVGFATKRVTPPETSRPFSIDPFVSAGAFAGGFFEWWGMTMMEDRMGPTIGEMTTPSRLEGAPGTIRPGESLPTDAPARAASSQYRQSRADGDD